MTAGELALVIGAVLCCIGFAALIVVLVRVLDTMRALRTEVTALRAETAPLLALPRFVQGVSQPRGLLSV